MRKLSLLTSVMLLLLGLGTSSHAVTVTVGDNLNSFGCGRSSPDVNFTMRLPPESFRRASQATRSSSSTTSAASSTKDQQPSSPLPVTAEQQPSQSSATKLEEYKPSEFPLPKSVATPERGASSIEKRSDPLSQAVSRGKAIFTTINKKYPGVKPFLWGSLSATPTLALVLPKNEWTRLSKEDQVNLTFYVESLISQAHLTPEKYVNAPQNAPIFSIERLKAANLCPDCWAIGIGQLLKNKKEAEYDETVLQGDSVWEKDNPCCRGVKAVEFRQGFIQKAEVAAANDQGVGHASNSGAVGVEKRSAANVFKARLESFNQLQSTVIWRKDIHAGVEQQGKKITFLVTDRWHLLSRDMKEAYVKESWTWFFQMGRLADISEKPDDYSLEVKHNQSHRILATWDGLWGFRLKE